MKVTMITNEFPPNVYGGAGVHVAYLSRFLSKLMEVDVRCFKAGEGPDMQPTSSPHIAATAYGHWDRLLEGCDPKFSGAFKAMAINLLMAKDLLASDIIHTHTWYADFAGFLMKTLYRKPLVCTIHSMEPLRPWKYEQLGNAYYLSSWIEKNAIENADAVIAVSTETKNDVLRHFQVNPEKVHVIYNGIDPDEYRKSSLLAARMKYGIDITKPYLLFVGRITRQKGIIHLLNAIKYLDADLQIVLCAGQPDTEEIAKEMKDKVSQIRKDRSNLVWIDKMVSKKEVIELYSHAAVFCCPSIYEPFGIINLEAMACETPVVASAVGGINEVVIPNKTGHLVPFAPKGDGSFEPQNPDAFAENLADKINSVVRNPLQANEFGRNGRKRVEDKFSWTAIAKQTMALYKTL